MKKGFTLIELLVVITIFGVLVVIVIGQVNKGIDRAKIAALQQEIPQLKAGLELYHLDHNSYNFFEGLTRTETWYDFDYETGDFICQAIKHSKNFTWVMSQNIEMI